MSDGESVSRREAPLLQAWQVLVRRRATVVGFTAALLGSTGIGSALSTRIYRATAVIEISPKAPVVFDLEKVSDMVPTAYGQVQQYYSTQYRILRSRAVLDAAVRRLRERDAVTVFDGEPDPVGVLHAALIVQPESDTQIVRLHVEYPDADLAARFANTIAEAYMDLNLERSLDASRQALAWLQEQQEVYRRKKQESDARVQRYKAAHGLTGPDNRDVSATALADLEAAWSAAHTRRVTAEATGEQLERIRGNGGWLALATHLSGTTPVIGDLLGRREVLTQERHRLAVRYLPLHPALVELDAELSGVEQQLRSRIDAALAGHAAALTLVRGEEQRLASEIDQYQAEVAKLGEHRVELGMLTAVAERDELFFRNLDQRMTEVGLSQFLQANNIRFVDRATTPPAPARPQVLLNLLSALVVGATGGALLAFILENVDRTVKSREDVELVAGVPFLGVVPMIPPAILAVHSREVDRSIIAYAEPQSAVAECLRTVRTNLMFRAGDRPLRRLVVTSAVPREGKSFIAANLAAIVAMAGSRVLAVDADLRRPSLHKRYQLSNEVGLSQVLRGEKTWQEALQGTHVPGLSVLTAGPMPSNPSEWLGVQRIQQLLDAIDGFDFVLIDSPPVTVVSDALVLASIADGTLFVIEAQRVDRRVVASCGERLAAANARVLGAVVNKLDVQKSGYEYNYHYEDYGEYSARPEDSGAAG